MNEYNEGSGRRISLREQRTKASFRRCRQNKEKSSFLIRFNICLTLTAAVFIISRINTTVSNNITEKAEGLISEQISLSDIKDKAVKVFAAVTTENESEDIFSDKNSHVEKSITDSIEQNRELEEQLKNR